MIKDSKLSRRLFLSRSAAVTGGIITLGVLGVTRKANAQDAYEFEVLTDHQAATVEALAERIMPKDSNGPGATDARVVVYIDRALATIMNMKKKKSTITDWNGLIGFPQPHRANRS